MIMVFPNQQPLEEEMKTRPYNFLLHILRSTCIRYTKKLHMRNVWVHLAFMICGKNVLASKLAPRKMMFALSANNIEKRKKMQDQKRRKLKQLERICYTSKKQDESEKLIRCASMHQRKSCQAMSVKMVKSNIKFVKDALYFRFCPITNSSSPCQTNRTIILHNSEENSSFRCQT